MTCDGDIQCYQPFSKRAKYSEIEEYYRIGGYSILGKHLGRRETQEQKHFHDEMYCPCPSKLPKPCNCQENDNCQNNGSVCYNDSSKNFMLRYNCRFKSKPGPNQGRQIGFLKPN